MRSKPRARTDEAKQEKRNQLVRTAGALFKKIPYGNITMEAVAAGAGVAKGTVFVYFPTKEELFLGLAHELFTDFFTHLRSHLASLDPADIHSLKEGILNAVKNQDSWLKIVPLLDVIIEKNVREESLLGFKRYLLDEMTSIGRQLDEGYPCLEQVGGGAHFLFWLYGIIAGFLHLSNPAESAQQAIDSGGMDPFRFDFMNEFERFLTLFLNGLV